MTLVPGALPCSECRQSRASCGYDILQTIAQMAGINYKKKRGGLMTTSQLSRELRKIGVRSAHWSLNGVQNSAKLEHIKNVLRSGRPVILVVAARMHRKLPRWMGHYVLILGFDEEGFLVHDPSREVEPDKTLPAGNVRWGRDELLRAWGAGWGDLPGAVRSMFGFGRFEYLVPWI